MKRDDFLKKLQERWSGATKDELNENGVIVPLEAIHEILQFLRDDPETECDYLDFITAADYPPEHMHVIYSLSSLDKQHRLQLKVVVDRDAPTVPTVGHLWTNAEWNERETYDLFGVVFPGLKDPRRILMPEDWEGHPLRKDYLHANLASKPD